jgi:hypothetical protein
VTVRLAWQPVTGAVPRGRPPQARCVQGAQRLGWRPRLPLPQALALTVDWARQRAAGWMRAHCAWRRSALTRPSSTSRPCIFQCFHRRPARKQIAELVEQYAAARKSPPPSCRRLSPVPPSGKVLDAAELKN